MNTVGPYHNRQETYKYFSLPFCAGSKKTISHYHETLGEALQGVELEFSGLDIKFKGILLLHQTFTCWGHTEQFDYFSVVSESLNIFLFSAHYHIISNKDDAMCFIPVEEVMQTTYCEIDLDKAKQDAFVYAIKNHYWYQMYIDDLPIWGMWYWFHGCIMCCPVIRSVTAVFSGSVFYCPSCLSCELLICLLANLLIIKCL